MSYTKHITVFTNGKQLELSEKYAQEVKQFNVNTKEILRVDGSEFLQKVIFKDETSEEIDGLFIAYDSPSSVEFARKLGIIVDENAIVADRQQQTNLEGLFAAGDCTGGFKQISTAVGQGAVAGKKIVEYIRSL